MIVYHGSNVIVSEPKLVHQNRFLDFGFGFYTTTNKVQAIGFADKVTRRRREGEGADRGAREGAGGKELGGERPPARRNHGAGLRAQGYQAGAAGNEGDLRRGGKRPGDCICAYTFFLHGGTCIFCCEKSPA